MAEKAPSGVLDGINLILSVGGGALAYSTGCKISTTTETGERVTKEAATGKWKDLYVKSFSEEISADGCICTGGSDSAPTYDQLKRMQLAGEPVDVHYNVREGEGREGKQAGGYGGKFLITSLEADGQVGDDAKYSVKLQNCGPVAPDGNGFQEVTV